MKPRIEAYQHYFFFIEERMNIFWRRYDGLQTKLTNNKILSEYKFTNVYRVLDRVSQYLLKEVIYTEERFSPIDTLLRIIVFKVFNKIETWEYLRNHLGELTIDSFNPTQISVLLAQRIQEQPIFSAAYMMTGSHRSYDYYPSKHEKWLMMIEREMIKGERLKRILDAPSLSAVFNILSECSFIGDFLAYQYAIDMNYSDAIDFDEDSFVKAGIGAIRGIKKCFDYSNKYSLEDYIHYTQENLETYQHQFGAANFKSLFGRPPKLIDIQNCFCETDKYLRAKMPHIQVDNVRIKQKFTRNTTSINYVFPPKWRLLTTYTEPCNLNNTTALTLF